MYAIYGNGSNVLMTKEFYLVSTVQYRKDTRRNEDHRI